MKEGEASSLDAIFGDDIIARLVFQEMLFRAADKDMVWLSGNNRKVPLKRGQVPFGRSIYLQYFGGNTKSGLVFSERQLREALERIIKQHKQASICFGGKTAISSKGKYTVLELKNYDTHMENVHLILPKNVQLLTLVENELKDELQDLCKRWDKYTGGSTRLLPKFVDDYGYWREFYTVKQISAALWIASEDQYWKDKITIPILLRRTDSRGDALDRVGEFLNKQAMLAKGKRINSKVKTYDNDLYRL